MKIQVLEDQAISAQNKEISPVWPNIQSMIISVSIAATLACIILNTPFPITLCVGGSIRLVSSAHALYSKNFKKIGFDAASFAAFFLPYGKEISLVIDCVSEIMNYSQYRGKKIDYEFNEKNRLSEEKERGARLEIIGKLECQIKELKEKNRIVDSFVSTHPKVQNLIQEELQKFPDQILYLTPIDLSDLDPENKLNDRICVLSITRNHLKYELESKECFVQQNPKIYAYFKEHAPKGFQKRLNYSE